MERGTGQALPSERDAWSHARLIPMLGTRDKKERERRATSCLLAVMHGVPEFGRALLKELGAPSSREIKTFTEVRFKTASGKPSTPDGAISCRGRKGTWTCLLEVKTGNDRLRAEQVTEYVDLAREHDFDAVLTISPQITTAVKESPVEVSGKKLRRVCLYHYSWWEVITRAIVQQRFRGVSDTDQDWVLRELIHYLTSPNSGTVEFEDMGPSWVVVRDGARRGTLGGDRNGATEIAGRWDQFCFALCLSFTQSLGVDVRPHRRRGEATPQRLERFTDELIEDGVLERRLEIPNAIAPLELRVDLRARQTATSVSFAAADRATLRGRVGWLTKQLKEAPDGLLVTARFPNVQTFSSASLGQIRADPKALCHSQDPKRLPRSFTLTLVKEMGRGRGRGEGTFAGETTKQALGFYREIVEELTPWQPAAPQTQEPEDGVELPPGPPDH